MYGYVGYHHVRSERLHFLEILQMTEQVLKVLGKLDEQNTRSIFWVTLEQANY